MYLDFNGQRVVFAASYIEKLINQIGDGKTFRYPESVYKLYEMENGQKKRMGPKSRGVQLTDTVSLEITPSTWWKGEEITDVKYSESAKSQQVRVTWYTDALPGHKISERKTYKPSVYNKPGTLTRTDYMLWFYLSVCARTVKGSDNSVNNSRKRFMIEMYDPASHATKTVKDKQYKVLFEAKIYASEDMGGLSVDKLKDLAAALQISEKEWKTTDMLRVLIDEKVKVDQVAPGLSGNKAKYGYEYAMELINQTNVGEVEFRANVRKAIDSGVIRFNINKNAWFYCDPAAKPEIVEVEQVCLVPESSLDPLQTLLSFLKIGKNYDKLKDAMNYANVTPGLAVNNLENIKNRIREIENGNGRREELIPLYIELTNLKPTGVFIGKLNKLAEEFPHVYDEHKHKINREE